MIFTTQITLPISPNTAVELYREFETTGAIPGYDLYVYNIGPDVIRLGDMVYGPSEVTGYPIAAGAEFSMHVPAGIDLAAIADDGASSVVFNLMIVI
jgi:hypothetical protein